MNFESLPVTRDRGTTFSRILVNAVANVGSPKKYVREGLVAGFNDSVTPTPGPFYHPQGVGLSRGRGVTV